MTRSLVYGSAEWRRWKHHHHWATGAQPADPLGAGNTALISALGGNSVVLGFWDTRQAASITLSGSSVATWADVRGSSGFGPTLAPAFSGQKPAWDATNLVINFTASSSHNLENASVSGWSLATGLSVALVLGSATAVIAGVFAEVAAASPSSLRLTTSNPSTNYVVTSRDTASTLSTAPTTSVFGTATTRRLLLGSTAGSGGVFTAEAPTATAKTGTNTGTFGATGQFNLGRTASAGSFVDMSLRAVVVLAGAYTTAQRDALKTWSITYHGATLL